jgi:Zn-dependent protease with chaperone function/Zn-finger nucleic acid-binding protein
VSDPAARRTLFAIEREKRWRIWLLFGLLLLVVFVSAWAACFIATFAFYLSFPVVDTYTWVFTLRGIGLILAVALAGSLAYWWTSQVGARGRLLAAMHCQPLDAGDRYHHRLSDIADEIRIATGAPRIDCFVVPTLGLNAFAFSDLRGAGVIGVTEGALARLSRQQLQGVVAHEFAHILSGTYITVTVSCLLFGIYSELGDKLEDAALAGGGSRAAPLVLAAVALRGWLWLLQVASSITNAALSRERELQADLAAARYTRDPLSLAEALRVIGRHPGGAGYIPEGLAPLCIRDAGARLPRLFGGRREARTPLSERVTALLTLANVDPDAFVHQEETAEDVFARREHWAPPPASAPPPRLAAAGTPTGSAPAARPPAATGGAGACPSCGAGLRPADYEGVDVLVCASCGGRLLSTRAVSRILARREASFTEAQGRLADLLTEGGDRLRRSALLARGRPGVDLIPCPSCAAPMVRRHFSYEYAVEIDYCGLCDLYWFERDELEALQILSERATG